MNQGFIYLWRTLLDEPIANKPKYLSLWVTLLLMANHKDKEIIWNNKLMTIKKGQILTGRKALAKQTHIRERTVEDILTFFETEWGEIQQQKTNKFRIININKYIQYQAKPTTNRTTRRTTNQQLANTNNNDNNDKKESIVASLEALRLADLLATKVKANNPSGLARDVQPAKWAEDIDKLHRLDKQPWPLIEKVLIWSQNDSFWKQNIRSGFKLRKQWSQLTGKMNQEKPQLQHHPSDYVQSRRNSQA